VLSVRRPEVPAGCVQLGLLPPGTDADPRQPVFLAAAHALVQRLRGVVQVPATAPDLGEGEQEVRTGVTVQRRLEGLRTQSGQHRGLGVRQPPEAHERPADGVEPADPHGDVVPAGQVLQLRAPAQRLLERPRQGLAVRAVVEHEDLAVDVAELLREPEDVVVAVPRRDVPSEPEAVGQAGEVVDPRLGQRVLAQQFHGADGVLEGQRHVAELLEDRGQHEVRAGEEQLRAVFGGPAVDLLGAAAALGRVAASSEQVGLDQAGAQCELDEAERLGGRDGLLGALLDVVSFEPREVLQLGDGRPQRGGAGVVEEGWGRRRVECVTRSLRQSLTRSVPDVGGAGHTNPSDGHPRSLRASRRSTPHGVPGRPSTLADRSATARWVQLSATARPRIRRPARWRSA
jgi:hypothetical protein